MNKKILAMLLVGVVLGCCACGSSNEPVTTGETTEEVEETKAVEEETETTVSDEVVEEAAETSTEEETTETNETEEVTEKNVVELASDYLDNSNYLYIKMTTNSQELEEPEINEFTLNRVNSVVTLYTKDGAMWCDAIGHYLYIPGSTETEWYKAHDESDLTNDPSLMVYTDMVLHPYDEVFDTFNIEEITDEDGRECYYATTEFVDSSNSKYRVAVKIDKSSNLATNVTAYKIGDEPATVETDEAVITGEDPIIGTTSYDILYFDEADENFNDFVSLTTLPADENCVLIDAEGNIIEQ